ncbi:hypothetical protein [Rubrivirga sp.]|uniref:hypothetical protein n=1 Tax=Rubrivirga sp. TaxID=1885344 RepID=UPI003B520572
MSPLPTPHLAPRARPVARGAVGLLALLFCACDVLGGGDPGRLTADGEAAGFRVATDGRTAVVGVSGGAVAVYGLGPDGWTREADLRPAGSGDGDGFGWSVAVAGDVVVVGALSEGGTLESPLGAAYVFERRAGGWSQTARLDPADLPSPRIFSRAVAVGGGRVFVSSGRAWGSDEPDVVQVFERANRGWVLARTILPPDPARTLEFGAAVAVDGSRVVVGATTGENADATAGTVYVYELGGDVSGPAAVLPEPAGIGSGSRFGSSVAVDGDRIVVGAPATVVGGERSVGAAFVFEEGGAGWVPAGRLDNPEPSIRDFFAESVGIDEELVVVGSESEDRGRGAVFTFERQEDGWAPTGPLAPGGLSPSSSFGSRLALSDGVLLVGAPYDGRGAAYVYRREGGAWALW